MALGEPNTEPIPKNIRIAAHVACLRVSFRVPVDWGRKFCVAVVVAIADFAVTVKGRVATSVVATGTAIEHNIFYSK